MRRKRFRQEVVRLALLIFIVSAVFFVFGSDAFKTPKANYFTQLDSWSVQRAEISFETDSLSSINLGRTKKGETVTISCIIPDYGIENPTIMLKSLLSTVDIRIDGELIFSYGYEYADKNWLVPQRFHFITLNQEEIGKEISITFTYTEHNGFRIINPIYYGSRSEIVKDFLQSHRLPIFVGCFLVIYSCIFMALGIYMLLSGKKNLSLFFNASISMLLGIYIFAYNDIFCFISNRDYLFSILEYISLYLIPLSVSVLLLSTHPEVAPKLQRVLLVFNIILPWSAFIAHSFGFHMNHFVPIFQFVIFTETIMILPALIKGMQIKRREKIDSITYTGIDADNYLMMGFIFIIFFAMLEIAKFNILKFYGQALSFFTNISYLTLGVLYFIICLFIYFFLNEIEHQNSENIKQHLKGLAYTDALTGLMNRAKCMQYLASVNVPYALVSLDLDRLKYVNDTYGHLEGDRMLKAFSDLLKEAFDGAALIGRTGGDEFLVVIENPSADICDKCLRSLEESMNDFNKIGAIFTLSASAGYAFSTEAKSGKVEDVFYIADNRMYEMKERHHNA